AVVVAERAAADPDELAERAELVERRGPEVLHARRHDAALELGERQRQALELLDRPAQRRGAPGAVPLAQEARVGRGLAGGDLAPEARQGAAAELAQDLGVAPFLALAARAELALEDAAGVGERVERRLDLRGEEAEAPRGLRCDEGAVRPRVAGHEPLERAR